jgi:hypothetical protein
MQMKEPATVQPANVIERRNTGQERTMLNEPLLPITEVTEPTATEYNSKESEELKKNQKGAFPGKGVRIGGD